MNNNKRVLTGIKPTGYLHIGNYFGAIKPAIKLAQTTNNHIMFIADYHALNALKDKELLGQHIKEIACTYLAAGLNPEHSVFYKQSDVPEICEIATIISAFTSKGLMNKSHAYKAKADKNVEAGLPTDDGVNMGLYTYPILMASDILTFDTDIVPVGRDQVQHVEIARDIAGSVNAIYGDDTFVLPNYVLEESVAVIPGIDGRKMSKSYNNVIPLLGTEAEIKKAIFSIKTDSRPMEEPKNPDEILIYEIFKSCAPQDKIPEMAEGLKAGKLGYGHIKTMLFDCIMLELKDFREKYFYYMENSQKVEEMLDEGAKKARFIASNTLKRLKNKIFLQKM